MRIHFIGIGGIGVSALAQYYLAKGANVSGSDLVESETIKNLRKKGAKIFIGHKATNVPKNVDLVIYTPATPKNNPELKEAKSLKIRNLRAKRIKFSSSASLHSEARQLKILSYPQALGELAKEYFTIAVCGTHGKSTTTAMISLILIKAGLNPTVIIGTKLKEFGDSNFRLGGHPTSNIQNPTSKILVIEADEYAASFLNYWPQIIVLTNVEKDHLDYYKNLNNILKAFKEFISHLPKNGYLIFNKDDKNIKKLLSPKMSTNRRSSKKRHFSLSQNTDKEKLKEILKVPGEHNIQNALAALTCARVLKIPDQISFEALSQYHGAWRRFEIFNAKLITHNLQPTTYKLISDYGHHPTEIKATLQAAREKFPHQRIILIFQPHQYQRTKLLFKDFVKSFDEANILILTEIYGVAGREKGKTISAKDLAEAVKKRQNSPFIKHHQSSKAQKSIVFIKNMKDIPNFLAKILRTNDVVIIMGAGDIYNLFLRLHQGKKNNLS